MSPRSLKWFQITVAVVGIISLLSGLTAFGVLCLLVAMAPSFYQHVTSGRSHGAARNQHHPSGSP